MGIWQRIPDQTNSKHKKVWSDQQQDRLRTSDREAVRNGQREVALWASFYLREVKKVSEE